MPRKPKQKCHYCSTEEGPLVAAQHRFLRGRRYLCNAKACWCKWWADVDAAKAAAPVKPARRRTRA